MVQGDEPTLARHIHQLGSYRPKASNCGISCKKAVAEFATTPKAQKPIWNLSSQVVLKRRHE
jgi:hypothetical protein